MPIDLSKVPDSELLAELARRLAKAGADCFYCGKGPVQGEAEPESVNGKRVAGVDSKPFSEY